MRGAGELGKRSCHWLYNVEPLQLGVGVWIRKVNHNRMWYGLWVWHRSWSLPLLWGSIVYAVWMLPQLGLPMKPPPSSWGLCPCLQRCQGSPITCAKTAFSLPPLLAEDYLGTPAGSPVPPPHPAGLQQKPFWHNICETWMLSLNNSAAAAFPGNMGISAAFPVLVSRLCSPFWHVTLQVQTLPSFYGHLPVITHMCTSWSKLSRNMSRLDNKVCRPVNPQTDISQNKTRLGS